MPAEPDFENEVEKLEKSIEEIEEPEAREIFPFKTIQRGQDTLGNNNDVIFADFSPITLPSDVEEDETIPEPAPKEESAQEPVPSEDSQTMPVQTPSETPVQQPAKKAVGKPNQSESG